MKYTVLILFFVFTACKKNDTPNPIVDYSCIENPSPAIGHFSKDWFPQSYRNSVSNSGLLAILVFHEVRIYDANMNFLSGFPAPWGEDIVFLPDNSLLVLSNENSFSYKDTLDGVSAFVEIGDLSEDCKKIYDWRNGPFHINRNGNAQSKITRYDTKGNILFTVLLEGKLPGSWSYPSLSTGVIAGRDEIVLFLRYQKRSYPMIKKDVNGVSTDTIQWIYEENALKAYKLNYSGEITGYGEVKNAFNKYDLSSYIAETFKDEYWYSSRDEIFRFDKQMQLIERRDPPWTECGKTIGQLKEVENGMIVTSTNACYRINHDLSISKLPEWLNNEKIFDFDKDVIHTESNDVIYRKDAFTGQILWQSETNQHFNLLNYKRNCGSYYCLYYVNNHHHYIRVRIGANGELPEY